MMNRKLAALLAAALVLGLLGASALAAGPAQGEEPSASAQESQTPEGVQEETEQSKAVYAAASSQEPEPPAQEGEEPEPPAELVPDPVGTLSFANLDSRMRENNFNLLALEENIAAVEAIDYEKMTEDIRKQINQIANAQWMLTISGNSFASSSLQQSYDALRDTFDDLKDGEIQEDNNAVIRQLRNAQDQVVMAGESIYVALTEMEMSGQTLDRTLSALDRTIQELELRYSLGQISALTLQQTKAGRTTAASGRQTLAMNISNYKLQLEQMVGGELTGAVQLQPLPQVEDQALAAMDLEADLAAAKEASYALFAAQRTLEDAQQDYKDAGKSNSYNEKKYQYVAAKHTWEAAQYTYNATMQSFENSFRTLYNQVKDYQQILSAAQTALAVERDSYAADQLKFEQGTISENTLLTAQDDLAAAQDTVASAAIDLFSAYNNYRWAVDHGILN